MSEPKPLFVDTNAFIALFDQDDVYHDRATAVIDRIGDGTLQYGPIFTSRYVLSETATTLLYGVDHRAAVQALETIRSSSTFNVLEVDESLFDRTAEQFAAYDDHRISFVDQLNAVLSAEFDIEHIFAFEDDFRTLGLTRVPVDTGDKV